MKLGCKLNIVFTKHAREQMNERGISEDEVLNTVKYPDKTMKRGEVYMAQKLTSQRLIEVVYIRERYIKVITVYPI
jgi:hypothetical protein